MESIRAPSIASVRLRAALCAVIALSLSACSPPYMLTVEDVVAAAGGEVTLAGKLLDEGIALFTKGLDERELTFYLDDLFAGSDYTDNDGYAAITRHFEAVGEYDFTVSYSEAGREFAQSNATVYAWEKDDILLIVDIDGTLSDTQLVSLISSQTDASPAIPEAAEVLGELADNFRIVYLTARPRELMRKTRQWLADNGFPRGPLLMWDTDTDPWSQMEYKSLHIEKLQEDFSHVTIGIGDAQTDYQAYRTGQLFSIMINYVPDAGTSPEAIEGGVKVSDWSTIRTLFAENPQLFETNVSDKTAWIPPELD